MGKDEDILEERGEKYGPMAPMWETIGEIQYATFKFLNQKLKDREPTPAELGHLAALNLNAVKIVRAIHDPKDLDHGIDGRNYWTIAERVLKGESE